MSFRDAGLPVLTYHALGDERSVTAADPARFAATLAAFHAAGRRPVALDAWVAAGRPDAPDGYAVAFDDGLASLLKGLDALQAYGVRPTIFVPTGRVGRDNAWRGQRRGVAIEPTLGWSDLRALAAMGFGIAAHGVTHRPLDRVSPVRLADELRGARYAIEDRIGGPCPLLAYPYGRSSAAVRRVAAREYDAAFGTRLDLARRGQDAFELARIDAYYLRDDRVVDALAAGRAAGWLRWRRTLRAVRQGAASLGRAA